MRVQVVATGRTLAGRVWSKRKGRPQWRGPQGVLAAESVGADHGHEAEQQRSGQLLLAATHLTCALLLHSFRSSSDRGPLCACGPEQHHITSHHAHAPWAPASSALMRASVLCAARGEQTSSWAPPGWRRHTRRGLLRQRGSFSSDRARGRLRCGWRRRGQTLCRTVDAEVHERWFCWSGGDRRLRGIGCASRAAFRESGMQALHARRCQGRVSSARKALPGGWRCNTTQDLCDALRSGLLSGDACQLGAVARGRTRTCGSTATPSEQ